MLKMKYITWTMLLILLAVMLPGCASDESGPEKVSETPVAEETAPEEEILSGEALYTYVTEEDNYKNWDLLPGTTELTVGNGPHGAFVTIYASDDAVSAIEENAGVMPYNSTILKENYNSDEELVAVTLMHKVEGFDPEHNDWYWLVYDANGTIQAEGSVESCYDCHSQRADNDYIFKGELK